MALASRAPIEPQSIRRNGRREAVRLPLLAVTPGEPAGIGPDIVAQVVSRRLPARLVIICDATMLHRRARRLGIDLHLAPFDPRARRRVQVLHVPLSAAARPGKLDRRNAGYVLDCLKVAADGCLAGRFDGMVTGPVHKGIINDAGVSFTGHTEFLAERSGTERVVMMLAGGGLRVALATTHVALKDVPGSLCVTDLARTIEVLAVDLRRRFGVRNPRIAVAGLNPHSGESGHMGREEIDVIAPAIMRARRRGIRVEGPIPADTLFNRERIGRFDAALTMYHDQGLPVLKFASFGAAVNVTLGLPIVRTSVDHGTALDVAGSGRADPGSLVQAIRVGAMMARGSANS